MAFQLNNKVNVDRLISFAARSKVTDELDREIIDLAKLGKNNDALAEYVVEAFENHLTMHLLQVMDKLVREIGNPYKSFFAKNIASSFCIVYEQSGNEKMGMYELRMSWNNIFLYEDLHDLDIQVKNIDPLWPFGFSETSSEKDDESIEDDDESMEDDDNTSMGEYESMDEDEYLEPESSNKRKRQYDQDSVPESKKRNMRDTQPVSSDAINDDECSMRSDENMLKLLNRLKLGYDSNLEDLAKEFEGQSKNSLHYFFQSFEGTANNFENYDLVAQAESIISHVRNDIESQDTGLNLPLMVDMQAEFGKFPESDDEDDIDYGSMARTVSSLMRGDLPADINSASAVQLNRLITHFLENVGPREHLPMPDEMVIPAAQAEPVSQAERNAILAWRRKQAWSEEEMAKRKKVQSLELAQVRELYLLNSCSNPFKVPRE